MRTKEEGGGNYGHHGSKAAVANMVGRLLSHDLVEEGVAVVMIHVSPKSDAVLVYMMSILT